MSHYLLFWYTYFIETMLIVCSCSPQLYSKSPNPGIQYRYSMPTDLSHPQRIGTHMDTGPPNPRRVDPHMDNPLNPFVPGGPASRSLQFKGKGQLTFTIIKY